jgi:hypothetical protein
VHERLQCPFSEDLVSQVRRSVKELWTGGGVDHLLLQGLYRLNHTPIVANCVSSRIICVFSLPYITEVAKFQPFFQWFNGVDWSNLCLLQAVLKVWIVNVALWSQLSSSLLPLLQTPSELIQFHCFRFCTPTSLWKTYKRGLICASNYFNWIVGPTRCFPNRQFA